MSNIGYNIIGVTNTLPANCKLVAVSKFHPVEALKEAYDAGQRIFGESRVQELCSKCPMLPDDIQWHFIGHLQTNKVRQVLPYVSLIHSGDSLKLLQTINTEAIKIDKHVSVLLQLHVAQEETKTGFTPDECLAMVKAGELDKLTHIRICGVMGMASNVSDTVQISREFKQIKDTFDTLKTTYFNKSADFMQISMGMSHDYTLAIKQGSTMVRVGTKIFGEREY